MAGDWGADDLARVLTVLADRLTRLIPPAMARFRSLYEPRPPATERNTVSGAAHNVSRHYDLSNDLFALFLDETMTYSCAVFEPGDSLEQAQRRKFEQICELVDLRADDHLLEIGTGWGSLAILDHLVRRECDGINTEEVHAKLDWHPRAGTVVVVAGELPSCDLCAKVGDVSPARYDAPLSQLADTRWGYLCPSCYTVASTGRLGLGLGQYLMESHEVPDDVRAALKRAREYWRSRGVNHRWV